ncbi:MAG: right-handed parallel beta-helix repeat-containing protein [Candidatus Thorarchaeota archaeon]
MKLVLSFVVCTVLLVSMWVPTSTPMTSTEVVHETSSTSVLSYEAHDPIEIVNDTDFATTAADELWEGDGSPETPFLIQGYEISPARVDISIQDTTLHFKILDCNITGASSGIYLENVSNGVIQDCLFTSNTYGIYLNNVTGIDVVGCIISAPAIFESNGVRMEYALDCSISSCVMQGATDSGAGIFGYYSERITLFNNTIFEFEKHGIHFTTSCYDLDILNNTLYWNEGTVPDMCGIQIQYSELAYICGNNITENALNGITLQGAHNVTIIENHIVDNLWHGIYLQSSYNCTIQDNWIEGNGEGAGAVAGIFIFVSDYYQIIGNEFLENSYYNIRLQWANFGWVFNNYINDSYDQGINVLESHNVTIEENEIYHSNGIVSVTPSGIFLDQCENASIIHNILGHNSVDGIFILESHNGRATSNTIFDSENIGLMLFSSSNWIVCHNVIYDSSNTGISLDMLSFDNLFYHNDVGWSGVSQVYDGGYGNDWNYTTTGNWYSDYSGTGIYSIFGGVIPDYYPSMSLYLGTTTPGEYEVGTTGNTMTWDSSALHPETYELLIDDVPQGHVEWDGSTISVNVDGLSAGVHNITLFVYHVSGHWLSHQSTLTVVDTQEPVWSIYPSNQHHEYGSPFAYQISAGDYSEIDEYWLTGDAGFVIDNTGFITNTVLLEVGIYDIIVHVNDTFGYEIEEDLSIYVSDTIAPVWVGTPTNQEIIVGDAFSYQLEATDLAGVSWSVNNTVYFAISQDGLVTNVADLAPGVYYLEITVTDGNSNSISDTIMITVTAPVLFDPAMVLAIGGVGAAVVIILIVLVIKKK